MEPHAAIDKGFRSTLNFGRAGSNLGKAADSAFQKLRPVADRSSV